MVYQNGCRLIFCQANPINGLNPIFLFKGETFLSFALLEVDPISVFIGWAPATCFEHHQQSWVVVGLTCLAEQLFVLKRPADQSCGVLDDGFYVLCQTNVLMLKYCCWNTQNMSEVLLCEQDNHCPLSDGVCTRASLMNYTTYCSLMMNSNIFNGIRSKILFFLIYTGLLIYGEMLFPLKSPHDLGKAHLKRSCLHDLSRWLCPITIISIFNL